MPAPFGITPTGISIKSINDILQSFQQSQLQNVSPNLDLVNGLIAKMNGIYGAELALCWQVLGALYDGMDPDTATDDQLAGLALLTGTRREAATQTQVIGCTVNVNGGFDAPAGTMFASVSGSPLSVFTNKTEVQNTGGSPANVTVDFEAVNTGPIICNAGTLTVKAQALTGWNSITNPTDGVLGSNVEQDPALRQRRDDELAAAGSSTAAAIRADVLEKLQPPAVSSPTTSCTVLWNDTDVTDANGVPPHSIEVIARQPGSTSADDQALADLMLTSQGGGIGTHGLSSKTSTDSQGTSEAVYFTRPVDVDLYIAITITKGPNYAGDPALKTALVDYAGNEYQPGSTVYRQALIGSVFQSPVDPNVGVAGVLDVTAFTIDTNPVPVGTSNITMADVRHIARLDTSRITISYTP